LRLYLILLKRKPMKFILNNKVVLLGSLAGAVAGYLYYHFVGCGSGSCMITSRPVNSTLYGAVMGFLLSGSFRKSKPGE
jgi:phage shock protein E